jgi:CHAD domain-containing protein
MSVSRTRSELLKQRVDPFTRALNGVEQGDVKALHRARVASRRLRELLPMLQLDADVSRKLSRRLKKTTTRLGTVRELDVLLLLIDELHDSGRPENGGLSRIGVSVARDRDAARKRLLSDLPVASMRRLAGKLDRVVHHLHGEEAAASSTAGHAWRWALEAQVASRAGRMRTAIEEAGAIYLAERLHAVRIAVKKLRYAFELLVQVKGARTDASLRALKRAQDVLGRMHDLQVLIERVREVQAALAPPNVAVWSELDQLIVALENDCRVLHGRYMRQRGALTAIAQTLSAPVEAPPSVEARRAG